MKKAMFLFGLTAMLLLPVACTYDKIELVETCDRNLVLALTNQTPSACGIASGGFTVTVDGAAAGVPVMYSLNGSSFQEDPVFASLAAGSFLLTVQQGVCTADLEVTIENAEGINATAEASPSDCNAPSGTITVNATDASGTVMYSLDGGATQASPTFSNLAPGSYTVTAEDEIGCQVSLEVSIASTVSFMQVEAIVTASCAISGCHAGNISPDFRVRDNIVSRAGRIASRTGSGTMPPPSSGMSLSQAEIDAIACWVADGAPGE